MRKWMCLGLCLVLAFFSGCSAPQQEESFSVVSTIFPYYDFARAIAGENGQVTMLLPPGGEVHGFEPTLQDIALIERCDVFLYNGGEGDGWVEDLLKGIDTSQKQVIRLMDHVELLAVGEQDHHHDHNHHHEESDEHIFTTPQNALLTAEVICRAMIAGNEEHGEQYEENFNLLKKELLGLQESYEVLRSAENTLVVADRFPFLYLTQEYSLSYLAAFSGCTANAEVDLKTLQELKTAAEQTHSGVVLCTEFSDGRLADTLAQTMGGKVSVWHSCHNVTREEWQQKVTYVALMEQNLTVLKEALGL